MFGNSKQKGRKYILLLLAVTVVFGFGLKNVPTSLAEGAVPVIEQANTGSASGVKGNPDTTPIKADSSGGILRSILTFMGFLLQAATTLLIWVIDVNNIKNTVGNPVTYEMWVKIRDIMNIFFILVLLFSAFCTIFQVEKFNYKKILLTLVIMALLVNFSFPIARIIIDFSNVLMYYFAKAAGFEASGTGGTLKGIVENSQLSGIINSPSNDTAYLIAAIIFTFIYAVTVLVISVLFVVRLAVLTFLVMFSSVAFVGSIVPFLSTQASKWWDNLFRYAFFGPIMIFMLYIAIQLMTIVESFKVKVQPIAGKQTSTDDISLITSIVMYTIPIAFLWVGLGVAQSMNIALASSVVGQGQKFTKWAGRTFSGYRTAMWAGRGAGKIGKGLAEFGEMALVKNTRWGRYVSPTVLKEAYKKRLEMKKRDAFEEATGSVHDSMNKIISGAKSPIKTLKSLVKGGAGKHIERTDYGFASHQAKVAKYQKEIAEASAENADYAIEELETAVASKNLAKTEAALKVLCKQNNFNNMMHAIGDKYGDGVKVAGPIHIKNAIMDILSQAGAGPNDNNNEFLAKEMMILSETGISAGNIGLAGMGEFDRSKRQFVITSNERQAEIASAKFQNLESQQRQKVLHHNSVLGEDENGNIADIDVVQASILCKFNEKDIDQMNRSRDDLRRQLKKAEIGVDDQNNIAISPEAKTTFEEIKKTNSHLVAYTDTIAKGLAKPEKAEKKKEAPESTEKKKEPSLLVDQYGRPIR